MKKFLALLLAVMMIASMSITAFAADLYYDPTNDSSNETNTTTGDVLVTVDGTANVTHTYYVVVTWKEMSFKYSFASGTTWDPENHQYVNANGTVGAWDKGEVAQAITVTNHSDASVTADAKFDTGDSKTTNNVTATVACESASETIGSAEGKAFNDSSLSITYKVSIDEKTPTTNDPFTLGTITVELSKGN